MTKSNTAAPVCDLPPLPPDDLAALRESIRRHGVLDPVHVGEDGAIIDGMARLRIAAELRKTCPQRVHAGLSDEEKRALRRSLNLARRHLTSEQKRGLVEAQLRDTPGWSNRRIAKALGVSHPTVAAVRESLSSTGKVTTPAKTEGRDGRARRVKRPDPPQQAVVPADVIAPDPQPGRESGDNARSRLLLGTCPQALAQIPDRSVDLVFSDPPYAEISRGYGRLSEAEWLELMKATATECSRVLKPTGSMVFIMQPNCVKAGRMRQWPWKFALWGSEQFGMVQDAYWFNTSPMPNGPVRQGFLRPAIKWFVWLGSPDCHRDQAKVLKERFDPGRSRGDERKASPSGWTRRNDTMYRTSEARGGATPYNVFQCSTTSGSPGSEDHPAVTPLPVADWWCRYLLPPGGVLLDPFVGSGTMLVAGLNNGASRVIGIDKEEQYLDICRRRLRLAEAA